MYKNYFVEMNFDFESPYIEFGSEDIPYSIYEIQGVKKISELSRQLRTFLNYKAAIIQYRFQPKVFPSYNYKINNLNENAAKLKVIASKFIKLLNQIKGARISYEVELKRRLFDLLVDKASSNQIKDIRNTTEQLFAIIHLLSEQEIHLDPFLLKFIINLSQEACIVYKILNDWASGYYDELRLNYSLLLDELNELVLTKQSRNKFIEKRLDLEEIIRE